MPKTDDIVSSIRLEGEQEYNRALKQANTQLKTLRTALKAETAELGSNASAQEKNAKKQESLRKQIAEQEKIVSTLKAAYEQSRKEMEQHPEVIAKWEQKYNQARTTLANMKNELEGVGDAFEDVKQSTTSSILETNAFADSFSRIGYAAGSVASTLEGIFSAVTSSVAGAITQLWEDVMAVANKANDWEDIAGFWNTSATNIQKWAYAVKGAHNNFDSLNTIVNQLVHMGKTDKITELLGVSDENFDDEWEYAMACMDALYKKRQEVDSKQFDNIMETLFGGKKIQSVLDLLNDWTTIQDNLDEYDAESGGLGMTEKQMQDMATLAEKVDHIAATWEAFKTSFIAGAFGEIGLKMAGDAQNILDSFISYMNADSTEEKEQALESMKESIESFFTSVGEIISNASSLLSSIGGDLSESENGIVSAIGKMMIELSKAMEWFANPDNWDKVKAFFEALFDIWLVGKGAQFIAKVGEAVASLKTLKLFSAMTGGAGGASTAGAGSETVAAGADAATKTGLFTKLSSAAAKVGTALQTALFALPVALAVDGYVRDAQYDREARAHKQESVNEFNSNMGLSAYGSAGAIWKQFGEASTSGNSVDIDTLYKNMMGGFVAYMSDSLDDDSAWFDSLFDISDVISDMIEKEFASWSENPESIDPMQKVNFVASIYKALTDELKNGDYLLNMGMGPLSPSAASGFLSSGSWNNQTITSADIASFKGVPAAIASSVKSGMSGISVTMDGTVVGRLVAPTVSRFIATQIP